MQKLSLILHRYLALGAAIVLLAVGLSGAALSLEGWLDRTLRPDLWTVPVGASRLSFDSLVARARAAAPGKAVTGLLFSSVPGRAAVVSTRGLDVFVNPYSGAVLGTRNAEERERTLPRRLHRFHESLLLGAVGGFLVKLSTFLAVVLVVTGTVLWWPDRIVRVRFSGSWKRIVFDLHHVLGIVAAIVVLCMATTGIVMGIGRAGRLLGKLDRGPAPRRAVQGAAAPGTPDLSLDSLARSAGGALPGAQLMFLQIPTDVTDPIVAAVRFPEDHTPGGRSRVTLDRYRGTVLQVVSTREAGLGTRINNVMRPLHTGDVFGTPTAVVWALAAAIMASQAVSGLIMWWNARAARRAAAART